MIAVMTNETNTDSNALTYAHSFFDSIESIFLSAKGLKYNNTLKLTLLLNLNGLPI